MHSPYTNPVIVARPAAEPNMAWLISSGDLRESPNRSGWATQAKMEAALASVLSTMGWSVTRANDVDPSTGHGFISSQRMGLEVFKSIPVDAPLIVAESVWQYSHHVLAGLRTHRGPILTVANFEGDAPGLVGLLGINGGLTKMGTTYPPSGALTSPTTISEEHAAMGHHGKITHDASHVRDLGIVPDSLKTTKIIAGVRDRGASEVRRRMHGHTTLSSTTNS